MPRRTSARSAVPLRVVFVTMDSHLASACERATAVLRRDYPGLVLTMHAASEWGIDAHALAAAREDIAQADVIVATMLFLEEHFLPILPDLSARRDDCDAMVCAMCAAEVIRLTKLGRFQMNGAKGGAIAWLKRLRGSKEHNRSTGAGQMKLLRRLPKLLRFVPGSAQDVRAYFLTMLYWFGGSEANIANLVRFLVDRYAAGERQILRGTVRIEAPLDYPEVGVYHPGMAQHFGERIGELPAPHKDGARVGLLLLRSYLLAGNTAHYDGVIAAMEARGLNVVPVFSAGLDGRPAIERFFRRDGVTTVDAVVSLTGFSLVGGPAYNDAEAAAGILALLDVPYIAAHPVEFQTLEAWGASERGLSPVENTMMVAIPEIDGATVPMVFGGRSDAKGQACTGCSRGCVFSQTERVRDMHPCAERIELLVARTARLIALRQSPAHERRVALVIFNFPPNAGRVGTAASLSVFASLFETLKTLKAAGYTVEVPADVDALRSALLEGNAARYGTDANVLERIGADDHVRHTPWLEEIEAQWGPAPGRQLSDGQAIFILGARFGNVIITVQPAFGYEGDPMRLLFERGFAPTHAFSAFYRYLRSGFNAHAVVHFGTHGALEFMPGKQSGLSGRCWPERLLGDLPNLYLYAANNPSEGIIAKRRSAATLISYLTAPITQAGLYKDLAALHASIAHWRQQAEDVQQDLLAELIQEQASALDLVAAEPTWSKDTCGAQIQALSTRLAELETTLVPHGLHVLGQGMQREARIDLLRAMRQDVPKRAQEAMIAALVDGASPEVALQKASEPVAGDDVAAALADLAELRRIDQLLVHNCELGALLRALDGRYIRPVTGGDVLNNTAVLPTGRNLHGFDPFRVPSAYALRDGARQAERLIARHLADGNALPESVALVLWGTDNLKTEGAAIGQALALMGAAPRLDSYGRVSGAMLTDLAVLGRPRIDVTVTLSGIFRDLLPVQIKLLAEAAYLAACADEAPADNFVRKHALAYQARHNCDFETAALRVFSNADGTYGANVNLLIDSSAWSDEDELAENFVRRKSFAYGRQGRPSAQPALMQSVLADVELTFQNLDSIELGITTVDNYFDTLGGVTRAVKRARGTTPPVYIGDQTSHADGLVRTLAEQVALETRTRMLNPVWYEGMLEHGFEGVRQIESHVTNTMGWSATTGQVQPWVYQKLTETYILDPVMRERLAALNPTSSMRVADRLLEAAQRTYWKPDDATLRQLQAAGEDLEDRLEGISSRDSTARLAA